MENQLGLQFLPPEVIGNIASYLSVQDILACSAACFLLRQALNDDLVWKKRCSFKALDYFKWGECEVQPDFEWEKNEPSSLPLSKICDWRKYFMMEAHLWRNWKFGDYRTVQIEFGEVSEVIDVSQVLFYEDFLFLHSYSTTDYTVDTLYTFKEIRSVQKAPFLHSTLNLKNLKEFVVSKELWNYRSWVFKFNICDSKLVISLKKLVFIYDITVTSFLQVSRDHVFFFDGSNGESCDSETETSIVAGNYFIGAKTTHDPENVQKLTLYLWNIQTGEKIKEESITLNHSSLEKCILLKSEDNKHLIVKLRVKNEKYKYHYYGYNISKLESNHFMVKVNYCHFKILFDDNVIGNGLQKLFLYNYKTSKKVANMRCDHEILKKTIKIVGGYLLFGTVDNVVYVLNPSSLAVINTCMLEFTIYSLSPICDKFVAINSTNCEVWQIGKTAQKLFKLPAYMSFAGVNRYGTKLALIERNRIKVYNFWKSSTFAN